MKRVSFDSHQSPSFDEEARIMQRHRRLLQDYLELQKEFVSKKKKLHISKQKRETLWAEVRFLRLRQAHLLNMRASETEIDKHQNINVQPEQSLKGMNTNSANEAVLKISSKFSDAKRISDLAAGKETIREAIRLQKKPKSGLINGKRVAKKKISQDQVVLEA